MKKLLFLGMYALCLCTTVVDKNDDARVKIAARNLSGDIGKVSGNASHFYIGNPLDQKAIATAIATEHKGNAVSPKQTYINKKTSRHFQEYHLA